MLGKFAGSFIDLENRARLWTSSTTFHSIHTLPGVHLQDTFIIPQNMRVYGYLAYL